MRVRGRLIVGSVAVGPVAVIRDLAAEQTGVIFLGDDVVVDGSETQMSCEVE
jgi:hypothetical protein